MKSVLISIQPKWCEFIALGKKIVEVRKTKPKLETPFKCYIYCTKGKFEPSEYLRNNLHYDDSTIKVCEGQGKVIGEFVCDKITPLFNVAITSWSLLAGNVHEYAKSLVRMARLTEEEMHSYAKRKNCYAWRISNLVIYDKPKELSGFRSYNVKAYIDQNGYPMPTHEITRPPQSWCYIEELEEKGKWQ